MRHQYGLKRLGRTGPHRLALMRNMLTSLLEHERCHTTVAKAKSLQRVAERYLTIGKKDTLANRRIALSFVKSKDVVHKLFAELGPRYKARNGGCTRITKTRLRAGDAAEMAVIELVDSPVKVYHRSASAEAATTPEAPAAT